MPLLNGIESDAALRLLDEQQEHKRRSPGSDPDDAANKRGNSWRISFTGETFDDYTSYIYRLEHYREPKWSCKYTNKTNLTFEDALLSERQALAKINDFPETHKDDVLKYVHMSTKSLKDLTAELREIYVKTYLPGESVLLRGKNKKVAKIPAKIVERIEQPNYTPSSSSSHKDENKDNDNHDADDDEQGNADDQDQSGGTTTTKHDESNTAAAAAAAATTSTTTTTSTTARTDGQSTDKTKQVKKQPIITVDPQRYRYKIRVLSSLVESDRIVSFEQLDRKVQPTTISRLKEFIRATCLRGRGNHLPWIVRDAEWRRKLKLRDPTPEELASAIAEPTKRKSSSTGNDSRVGRKKAKNNDEPKVTLTPDDALTKEDRKDEGPLPDTSKLSFKIETLPENEQEESVVVRKEDSETCMYAGDLLLVRTFCATFSELLQLTPFESTSLAAALKADHESPLLSELHIQLVRFVSDEEVAAWSARTNAEKDADHKRRLTKLAPELSEPINESNWYRAIFNYFDWMKKRDASCIDEPLQETLNQFSEEGYFSLSVAAKLVILRTLVDNAVETRGVHDELARVVDAVAAAKTERWHAKREASRAIKEAKKAAQQAAMAAVVGTGNLRTAVKKARAVEDEVDAAEESGDTHDDADPEDALFELRTMFLGRDRNDRRFYWLDEEDSRLLVQNIDTDKWLEGVRARAAARQEAEELERQRELSEYRARIERGEDSDSNQQSSDENDDDDDDDDDNATQQQQKQHQESSTNNASSSKSSPIDKESHLATLRGGNRKSKKLSNDEPDTNMLEDEPKPSEAETKASIQSADNSMKVDENNDNDDDQSTASDDGFTPQSLKYSEYWTCYDKSEQIEQLIDYLNPRGLLEAPLRTYLQEHKQQFKTDMSLDDEKQVSEEGSDDANNLRKSLRVRQLQRKQAYQSYKNKFAYRLRKQRYPQGVSGFHGQESRGGTTRSSRSSTRIGRRSSRTVQSSSESSSSLSDASSTNIVCDVCQKDRDDNKVILCDNCDHGFHTYCLDPPRRTVPRGDWVCDKCANNESDDEKKVSRRVASASNSDDDSSDDDDIVCCKCNKNKDDDKVLLCETCDLAYHTYCVGLRRVPIGDWSCPKCQAGSDDESIVAKDDDDDDVSIDLDGDEEEDEGEEMCSFCGGFGDSDKFIRCDGEKCKGVFHLFCTSLRRAPRGQWFCEKCERRKRRGTPPPRRAASRSLRKRRTIESDSDSDASF